MRRFLVVFGLALAMVAASTAPPASAERRPSDKEHLENDSAAFSSGAVVATETQGPGNTYVLLDSDDFGGPSALAAPTGCVSPVPITSGAGGNFDDEVFDVALPFAFTFFGVEYAASSNLGVGVNGGFNFTGPDVAFDNGDLGSAANAVNAAVYPFWDDLQIHEGTPTNLISYCIAGVAPNRTFSVIWENVSCNNFFDCSEDNAKSVSFFATLFEETNAIEFHYQDTIFDAGLVRNNAGSATIGIDSGDPFMAEEAYLQYSTDLATVEDGFAIRFWPATCDLQLATEVGTRAGDTVTTSADVYYAHHGDDTITFTPSVSGGQVCGGHGDDIVKHTTAASDVAIFGDEGSVTYPWTTPNAGDDVLTGGPAAEIMWGGAGSDVLSGGGGDDALLGGADNDRLVGGDGADTISGGPGNDSVFGGADNDVISGGAGIDRLRGEAGDDELNGEADRDILVGGDGADTINGGGGNDSIFGGNGNDTINGGDDTDVIRGGPDHDTIHGDGARDVILGEAGNDVIFGDQGNDSLFGGDGNDTLDGGDNTDLIRGDAGNDHLLTGNTGNDALVGGPGDDTLDASATAGSTKLIGDGGDDTITGSNQYDRIWGGDGNDTINAGGFNDIVRGGNDDDIINGQDGRDTLTGDNGNDTLDGGTGNADHLVGAAGTDTCNGGPGNHDTAHHTCETTTGIP